MTDKTTLLDIGYSDGDICGRDGCDGIIDDSYKPDGGCSCHLHPPCGFCTTPREQCPKCGWRLVDEETSFDNWRVGPVKANGAWTHFRPRPLDPSKIDYRIKRHTHFTQLCVGVYPQSDDPVADQKAVLAKVRGTFGGRFNYFGNGKFEYVAYTD